MTGRPSEAARFSFHCSLIIFASSLPVSELR